MSDHLPECYLSGPPNLCPMCEALRACEQRVLEDQAWVDHAREIEAHARSLALDAAREAVVRLEPLLTATKSKGGYDCCGCPTPGYLYVDAIAAIDALRGES